MRYLRLLKVLYRTSIQTDMEYRADFFTRILASLLGLVATVGGLAITYGYTTTLKGWTYPQVMVLIAVYYVMDGLTEMFIAPNMRNVMTQVREGTLDFVLLKPVNAQFLASFRSMVIWRAANVLVGIGLTVYSVARLGAHIGLAQAVTFAVTMAAGCAVVYSLWLVLVTLTFWFVRVDNIEQIVWQGFEAARYPIEIYPGWLRGALTYVVPVAFIITIPAQALSGRAGHMPLAVACAVGILSLTAASLFWRFGLKFYTGASS
jgi:ABC-2 type transport system permease protein